MSKSRKPRKPRDLVTLGMLLYCRSDDMRDRRERRAKDKRREKEVFDY